MLPDQAGLLEALFAFTPAGLQIYDVNGRSFLVNRVFRSWFGEPPEEHNAFIDDKARRSGVRAAVERAFRGETLHFAPLGDGSASLDPVRAAWR